MAEEKDFQDEENSQSGGQQLPFGGFGFGSKLFTMEGIMILMAAGLVDLFGLVEVIPVVGSLISFVVDIAGVLIIGGWMMFFQSSSLQTPARLPQRAGGKFGKIIVRFFCIGGEFVPVLGALPLWSLVVLAELLQSK